jgi:hypothetical protein
MLRVIRVLVLVLHFDVAEHDELLGWSFEKVG